MEGFENNKHGSFCRCAQMKILFIDPPGSVKGINSGIGYLCGALGKEGIRPRVLDFNNFKSDLEMRLKNELARAYDIVGFSVKTNTLASAVRIADICKFFSPKSTIIAGGPGVSITGAQFLRDYSVFDYFLSGEAEKSMVELALNLNRSEALKRIPGLGYREGNEVKVNTADAPFDLDNIVFPDYSNFDKISFIRNSYPLVTSRGCPYECVYCNVGFVSGRRFRGRSAENVLIELRRARQKYRIKDFQVCDDTFTQDLDRAKSICRLIIKEGLDLKWVCQNGVRADRMDKELLGLMKRGGCENIWFGIETLDEDVFNRVGKGESLKEVINAVEMTREAGIPMGAFFIIGLPGSNYNKDMSTLKKARRMGLSLSTWSLATPYPYTALWDWVKENARVLCNFKDVSFFQEAQCTFETEDYPKEQRLNLLYKANLAFSRYECLSAEVNTLKRVWIILRLAARYDPLNLPKHILAGLLLYLKKLIGIKRR